MRTGLVAVGAIAGGALVAAVLLAARGGSPARGAPAGVARTGTIVAVGAENEYADVIAQIGGRYVSVSAIMSNPNTDPHTFEASPSVAQAVSAAELVVQNGLGYDSFMAKIEGASPSSTRKVVDVQSLLRLPNGTPNPHLWYSPATMPAVARAIASDLSTLLPARASYFAANLRTFDASLEAWHRAIASLRARFAHAPVATTEPVADYLLQAAGIDNLTPFPLQADVMNGVDPSPQGIAFEQSLFTQHRVKAFVYNEQVTDSITESFLALARQNGIPVVAVYETMPTPGYDYQSWMLAETRALAAALAHGRSSSALA